MKAGFDHKIIWIDGLRTVIAVTVMLYHILLAFLVFTNYVPYAGEVILTRILFNGDFFMFVSCVLAGYFAWKGKTASWQDFLLKSVSRYVRFFICVFCSGLLLLLLERMFGYHFDEMSAMFHDSWYTDGQASVFSILQVFRQSIGLNAGFNSALWMFRGLFLGTVSVYFLKWMQKMKPGRSMYAVMVCFVYLAACFADDLDTVLVILFVLIGAWISRHETIIISFVKRYINWFWLLFIAMYLVSAVFDWQSPAPAILFMILLADKSCQKVLSVKPVVSAGKFSFGLYLVHMPVLVTVGTAVYLALLQHGIVTAVSAGVAVAVLLSCSLAVVFYYLPERFADKVAYKIRKKQRS